MNKTVTITINGIIFHVEEDAYERLKKYLGDIKHYFTQKEEGDEIMADIEISIADKFSEKISKQKQVITEKEVQELIEVMGKVEDFIGEEEDRPAEPVGPEATADRDDIPKKLYRNPDDKVIAGVCSGLAAYFGIDPVILRVIFAISIFAGGTGILVYLLLWLAMPEAASSLQKLEMRGKPVTLEKIRRVAEEKISPQVKNAGSLARKIVNLPFRLIAILFEMAKKILLFLGPILRWLFGLPVIFASLLGIFLASLLSAVLIFNLDSELIRTGIPLEQLARTFPFNWAVVAAWLSLVIPAIFVMLLGFVLISKKNIFNAAVNSTLIGIWMVALIGLIVISIDAAPRIEKIIRESEYGQSERFRYEFKDFDSVRVEGAHIAKITQGNGYFVQGIGNGRDLENINIWQNGRELVISDSEEPGICLFCLFDPVEMEITVPELKALEGRGAGRIEAENLSGEELRIKAYSGAKIKVQGDYQYYFVEQAGASKVEVSASSSDLEAELENASALTFLGRGDSARIKISGIANFHGFKYVLKEIQVDASDDARAEVNAGKIFAELGEAAKIYYLGEPEINRTDKRADILEADGIFKAGEVEMYLRQEADDIKIKILE